MVASSELDPLFKYNLKVFCLMLFGMLFAWCLGISIANVKTYSAYRQSQLDAKTFSLKTICRVDKVISRPQEGASSSMVIINSTFLVSFELTSNGTTSRQQFEEWSVPIPLRPDMLNSTYTCFVDPTDARRRPFQYQPDVTDARNALIFRLCLPGLVVTVGAIMILVILVIAGFELLFKIRPRCLFRVRTHPIVALHGR